MAIAGLHNVPVLESPILRDSQSPSSGRRGDQENVSTRASSILQRWRELEDECAVNRARERGSPRLPQESNVGISSCREGDGRRVREGSVESENGSLMNCGNQTGPPSDRYDRQSLSSEQSQDLGDVVGERVRKILQELSNNGGNVETPRFAQSSRSARAQQWPSENDRERVRGVRDWVQMNSQQRETSPGVREDQVSESGSQIELVRDREILDQSEAQPETSRRQFRKLCGRQALLDLLIKKQEERRQELQEMEGTRLVSGFAPRLRNRIQALLRLKNMRSAELSRPSSSRESELGLLRQRQSVSGLREGFLSRLDNNTNVQTNEPSDNPSDNDSDASREVETQVDSATVVVDGASDVNNSADEVLNSACEQNESAQDVNVAPSTTSPSMNRIAQSAERAQLAGCPAEDANAQQFERHVETIPERDMDIHRDNRLQTAATVNSSGSSEDRFPHMNHQDNWLQTASTVHSSGSSEDRIPHLNFQELSRSESEEFSLQHEGHENSLEHDTDGEGTNIHYVLEDQERASENENENDHESNMQDDDWQEQVSEYESSAFSNQWRNLDVETNRLQWPDGENLSHGALESEGGEQNDVQEDHWPENGSGTPGNWRETPSDSRLASDRVDTYYFSDDDNVNHIELRELVNRRRVSELLHSNFRESLDQLIQSYVERQANAPDDWELHEMLPPPYLARNRQRGTDPVDSGVDDIHVDESDRTFPTPPPPPPQALWGQGLHQSSLTGPETRQRPGTEWEIINDLRIDMAKLQQRLNNMQRMLEACMDMQLELQRSVRQEVSAALNRPGNTSESLESILPKDSFKWDSVRKGICCVCSTTNIDSLLYRCGHMCTCTRCADVLVQGNGKCPMCQAPVIEVIRAYFIQ